MDNNVIDIKTKGPIFNEKIRKECQEALIKKGVAAETSDELVSEVEKVICTAMVQAARNLGELIASKIFKALSK